MTLPTPFSGLVLWLGPLAIVIAGLATLVRLAARREREDRRARAAALRRAMQSFLTGGIAAAELRSAAAQAESETFWTVLETATLRRPLPARLMRSLARCPHVSNECRALLDDSPWRRELAGRRLGLIRSRMTRRALRRALVRGPEVVTQTAALALARQRDGAALRWLLAHPVALAHRTARARFDLLRAFGAGALPHLLEALERGLADADMERAVIDVLGAGRCRPAAPAIALRLNHAHPETRVAAARALGGVGARETVPALCGALRNPAWPVRSQAARALGRMGALEAVAPLGALLEDRAWWVRRHSAYALARLGPTGRAELERIREASADRYAREMAEEALAAGRPAPSLSVSGPAAGAAVGEDHPPDARTSGPTDRSRAAEPPPRRVSR